jgi:hypothetical protein
MTLPKTNTRVETVKTVIIAVLVTGIIAFVGGVKYEQANSHRIQTEIKAVTVKS